MVCSLSDVRIFDHVAIAPTPSEIDRCRESYAAIAADSIRGISKNTYSVIPAQRGKQASREAAARKAGIQQNQQPGHRHSPV